ncbi:ABC transporter substrate-binding protein [Paenibacillus xylaniclasticus]|uniref:ABC transporter substrate-binding protein n=1 Tax=Paenibacillus xylaniclasticus TaxID=588083 RepID=UPI001760C00F|nr:MULTISPECIES: ABC transporter substrate-binding protein [Paenibacillus]GFN30463.1 LacI family transcriptional regulator [Paenibacillus curdlanolyticus]
MKPNQMRTLGVILSAVLLMLTVACGSSGSKKQEPAGESTPASTTETKTEEGDAVSEPKIVLGFAQVGAESGWRTANTKSIQDSAKEAGIELKFSDAQQKQENQIKAIRSFIQQKVDVIAFSPVVESGWDTVLKEAKDAGIPVILTDRSVDTADTSLYQSFIGSDFVEEGRSAGKWLVDTFKDATEQVNIVELEGTTGSAPANDRKAGFNEIIVQNPNLKVIASQTGDFTRAKGKEVMQSFLKAHKDIDVLYAHNDDMALGAIQAIEAAGLVPGKDIIIISVDGVHDGFVAASEGKINFIVECNPLLGPQLMQAVRDIYEGKEVPKRIVTKEGVFTSEDAKRELPNRQY